MRLVLLDHFVGFRVAILKHEISDLVILFVVSCLLGRFRFDQFAILIVLGI